LGIKIKQTPTVFEKKRIETIDINVELHAYMTSFTSLEQGHRSAFTDRSVDPHRLRNP